MGRELEAVLPLSDVILDVTITPNRPDVMSILGIARELGAYYELPVRQPDTRVDDTEPETAAAVEVEDPLGCPRFVARQVSGIGWSQPVAGPASPASRRGPSHLERRRREATT